MPTDQHQTDRETLRLRARYANRRMSRNVERCSIGDHRVRRLLVESMRFHRRRGHHQSVVLPERRIVFRSQRWPIALRLCIETSVVTLMQIVAEQQHELYRYREIVRPLWEPLSEVRGKLREVSALMMRALKIRTREHRHPFGHQRVDESRTVPMRGY